MPPPAADPGDAAAAAPAPTPTPPGPPARLGLGDAVDRLPGLGPVRVRALGRLGLTTLADLITHYPRRYEDRRQFPAFPRDAGDQPVCVCGDVIATSVKRLGGRRTLFEAILQEPEGHALSGRLAARWFNAFYVHRQIAQGQRLVVYGKPKRRGPQVVIDHPEFEVLDEADEEAPLHLRRIVPVHPTTEGLSARALRGLVHRALEAVDLEGAPELLPPGLDPLPRGRALRAIHFPRDEAERVAARRHLVLTEFFMLQLVLAARRARRVVRPGANHCGAGRLLAEFLAALPFTPTGAQRRAVDQIRADLTAARPMNRLLQGDVGAGKTLVALAAMLLVVEAGFQAVLMAPTQILAEQHFLNFRRSLAGRPVRLALRTGSRQQQTEDPELSLELGGGDDPAAGSGPGAGPSPPEERTADIVVGTHALLYEKAPLPRLGLVVIDEQHKFGVLQRGALLNAPRVLPDLLVMSATPIPRTLAITLYGDLDVAVLDELPAGRGPIVTAVRPAEKLPDAARFVRAQLEAGRQAYLVYPLVDQSDQLNARAATERLAYWEEALRPHRCALLHGRMGTEEKEALMRAFREGTLRALVTTTVIEVGVDVANANLMLIENAERFGLAQLHQLRGRVGRGAHKSYCVLLTGAEVSLEATEKLRVLERTGDGFQIAEADLRLRGPGDILGTAQSGLPPLKLGDLVDDAPLMDQARAAARELLEADPELTRPENGRYREFLAAHRKLTTAQMS